jgi:hypothetical protein
MHSTSGTCHDVVNILYRQTRADMVRGNRRLPPAGHNLKASLQEIQHIFIILRPFTAPG